MKPSSVPIRGRRAAVVAVWIAVLSSVLVTPDRAGARPAGPAAGGPATWQFRVQGDAAARAGVPEARFVAIDRPAGPLPDSIRLAGVPTGPSASADFQLERYDVFTPDARIVAMTENGEVVLPPPTSRVYRGRSLDGTADAILGVDGPGLQLLVNVGGETLVVLPVDGPDGRLVMAKSTALRPPSVTNPCGMELVPENQAFLERWNDFEHRASEAVTTTTILEAGMMIDVNNSLFAGPFGGSTTNATNYINTLVGAVSAIYLRDVNVRLRISSLTIWTTADPFSGTSSNAQLVAYKNWCGTNRAGVTRDLAHLFANGNVTNYGGIAYISALCSSSFGYAVSNIYASVSFPTPNYQWDINVTAHEMGHNFGSTHTHCFSPPIDMCYGQEAGCYSGPSVATLGTIMSYCHLTSGGINMVFHQRCIDVIRPTAESSGCLSAAPNIARDTVGIYVGSSSVFFLRNSHAPGASDVTVSYGPAGAGWTPLVGDWNNDGVDTPGLYVPSSGTFFLRNSLSPGSADVVFGFGPAGAGWKPIVGDWNGDGVDSVGLYNPATGSFFLRNSLSAGSADKTFNFGPSGLGWLPIAGDWDGDTIDTVGVYDPGNSVFYLRNQHASGSANVTVSFGPAGAGWVPIAGDWNGDSIVSIGLYAPSTGTFFLRNLLTPGAADLTYSFGGANATPVVGNWDAN